MKAKDLIKEFKKYNFGPYLEVPCSIFAPLISELMKDNSCEVIKPTNEAVAIGMASGSYLACGKLPVIIMQNSGFCNTLNCLTSLNQLYDIPVLYLISWRGEPKTKDAPEHLIIGKKIKKLFNTLDIPYSVLSGNYKKEIANILKTIDRTKKPAALLLREGLFEKEKTASSSSSASLTKEKAIDIIIETVYDKAHLVATNGLISRELFDNLNKKNIEDSNPPFYMLGSMGHALSIGLGLERYIKDNKKVIVLDGDGGCLMHLESLASVAEAKYSKLIHIVLDNRSYSSTGGQPTISDKVDFCKVAKGCGYKNAYKIYNKSGLKSDLAGIIRKSGPTFIHVLISGKEKPGRMRVSESYSCRQIKKRFVKALANRR